MNYEEKVIDEVLHYRTGVTSPWKKMTDEDLTLEVLRLRQQLEKANNKITYPVPNTPITTPFIGHQVSPRLAPPYPSPPWHVTCTPELSPTSTPPLPNPHAAVCEYYAPLKPS